MTNFKVLLLSFFSLYITSQGWAASASEYHHITDIKIGGKGGWDALTVEPKTHRLFVSHADRVVVIDLQKNSVIKEISGMLGVHCIAFAQSVYKAFVTGGKEGAVTVIDLKTLEAKTKIKVGENPDAIVFDPRSGEIYAFNANSSSVSVIDPASEKVTQTITLPGKPEFAIAGLGAVFVNLEDKNELARIDTKKHKVDQTWPLEGCESPSGIAIDQKHERIFSACENEKMVVTNARNGKFVATIATGPGTDGAEFDSALELAFSPNGKSGDVTVIHEDSPDKFTVVQRLKTQVGARTIALDSEDHHLYLPTANFEPSVKGERPKPVDDSQKIMSFGN